MQILRIPLLACATAICVTPLMLQAYDNENQLRARQALEQKMKELATQPVAETSAPPVTVVKPEKAPAKKPAKPEAKPKTEAKPKVEPAKQPAAPAVAVKPQPAPAVTVQKPQPTPAPTPPAAPVVVFKEPGQPPKEIPPSTAIIVAPGEPARSVSTAPPTAPAMPAPKVEVSAPPAPAPAPMDSEKSQKLQEAMHQKMGETQTNAWQKPYVVPPNQQHPVATAPGKPEPTMNLAPLPSPASSLSATKEQRLEQLLQLYRADQITPQQYHDQRAKILAEP